MPELLWHAIEKGTEGPERSGNIRIIRPEDLPLGYVSWDGPEGIPFIELERKDPVGVWEAPASLRSSVKAIFERPASMMGHGGDIDLWPSKVGWPRRSQEAKRTQLSTGKQSWSGN